MDTCKNVLKSDTLLFERFQKFVDMYEQFQIFLDTVEQLKNFLAIDPHAMSTSSNKGFASFSKWILDSGATHHMSYLLSQFISLNLNSSKSIVAANGDSMPLAGVGSVDTPSVALSDVYYIPSLTMNLASISKICDSGCDVKFSVSDCSIYDRKTQEVVGTGHRQGDLYVLDQFRDIHATASSSVDLYSFWLNQPIPIVSPITPEPPSEPTTSETPPVYTPSETVTTTETPSVTVSEATPTVTQPPSTTTQSSSEPTVVLPANVRPTRNLPEFDAVEEVKMADIAKKFPYSLGACSYRF
ncbi:hypothetical protein CTI12_AA010300 [Artemisia annua]|uniref:Retrovirus-related Pol polyprotein from transposon TNT 1-94-like beta-barrel domain-containing protein n=1 Tax=Artemisia annua TaxID=35608 RepID=A0A2U1QMQ1_ARTAN|nr:hypothetical protein CTI12_AA010300 [Artemisia annua]